MGRPRLYNTDEERKEAKQRNAKAWYDKNKRRYNRQRRKARAKDGAILRKRAPAPPQEPKSRKMTRDEEHAENLRFCLQELKLIPRRFQEALGGNSVMQFLIEVTEECIANLRNSNGDASRATDVVHAHGVPFSTLHLATDKYGGWLLNLVGTDHTAHKQSRKMSNNLRQMGVYIDDIICRAMVGELTDDFGAGALDFQDGIALISLA